MGTVLHGAFAFALLCTDYADTASKAFGAFTLLNGASLYAAPVATLKNLGVTSTLAPMDRVIAKNCATAQAMTGAL